MEIMTNELRHEKTNDVFVHYVKTQISLRASAQSDQSLHCLHEKKSQGVGIYKFTSTFTAMWLSVCL